MYSDRKSIHKENSSGICLLSLANNSSVDQDGKLQINHLEYLTSDAEHFDLSLDMRFPIMWYVRPAKAQTSLGIRTD